MKRQEPVPGRIYPSGVIPSPSRYSSVARSSQLTAIVRTSRAASKAETLNLLGESWLVAGAQERIAVETNPRRSSEMRNMSHSYEKVGSGDHVQDLSHRRRVGTAPRTSYRNIT